VETGLRCAPGPGAIKAIEADGARGGSQSGAESPAGSTSDSPPSVQARSLAELDFVYPLERADETNPGEYVLVEESRASVDGIISDLGFRDALRTMTLVSEGRKPKLKLKSGMPLFFGEGGVIFSRKPRFTVTPTRDEGGTVRGLNVVRGRWNWNYVLRGG